MKSRKFDLDTKVAIVLEGLKGNITVAELCRKYKFLFLTFQLTKQTG